MSVPSHPIADTVLDRIRTLASVHGTELRDDAGLDSLLDELELAQRVPSDAFIVAANLLFHLLAADQPTPVEAKP